ncbi:MAG: hypothetical protein K2O47_04940 [Muribaculaceae bacterium]|nr:hypothetical protein [Muribaculaceae bacterium]
MALLVVGANYVTDGAVAVARRFNVSNLIIGLTVVALGSTMPDIVVCVESAFQEGEPHYCGYSPCSRKNAISDVLEELSL